MSKGALLSNLPDGPLRDAIMWPLNLLRDLPRRCGRLLGILATSQGLRNSAAFAVWLHSFLWALFDLFGGPEIAQIFLRLATETRSLTRAEVAAVSEILGPKAIRYREVRVAQRGLLRFVFQLNGNRAFATWHTINMPDGRDENLPLLVHELTHTFQYERVGSVYIGQGLWAQRRFGRGAYDYGGQAGLRSLRAAGKRYRDYNREQQGQIAQDYCAFVRAGRDVSAFEPFIAELRQGLI